MTGAINQPTLPPAPADFYWWPAEIGQARGRHAFFGRERDHRADDIDQTFCGESVQLAHRTPVARMWPTCQGCNTVATELQEQ